jgi:chromosome segregation ATPase
MIPLAESETAALESAIAQLKTLQEQNLGLQHELQQSSEKAGKLGQDVADLQKAVQDTEKNNADLQEKLKQSEEDKAKLDKELDEFNAKVETALDQTGDLRRKLQKSEDDLKALQQKLQEAHDRAEKTEMQNVALREELLRSREGANELRQVLKGSCGHRNSSGRAAETVGLKSQRRSTITGSYCNPRPLDLEDYGPHSHGSHHRHLFWATRQCSPDPVIICCRAQPRKLRSRRHR